MTEIQRQLLNMADKKYAQFEARLIPDIESDSIIGVRTPQLRNMAKQLIKSGEHFDFIESSKHKYFEEKQLHAFIISEEKDFNTCIALLSDFLPYIDNWATCDQLSPKIFKKRKTEILPFVNEWIKSSHTYTVRFGIGTLMQHFLDDDFDAKYPEIVASVKSENYYVNMMAAWYFATGLAKQYDAVISYLTERKLDVWVHNKTISKAVESYRINQEQKEFLKTLRAKK